MTKLPANYRIGTIYALLATALLASQAPFSQPAAERLSLSNFVLATQVILLCSVPLLLRTDKARSDFRSMLGSASNLKYFLALLLIGLLGHVLYFIALSKVHPIAIAAVLNLSPFWAAMVALLIAKKAIPTSYAVFFCCLAVAFAGAMMIAFSQMKDFDFSLKTFASLSPFWLFAVPVPVLFALSGTLIGKWFVDFDEMACIATTFVTASVLLIPITALVSYVRSDLGVFLDANTALILLTVGTVLGSSVGLVVYQLALGVTDEDNGFVSMFFLLGPALTALLSLAMSLWMPRLKVAVDPIFGVGLLLVTAPIVLFSLQARRGAIPEREDRQARVPDAVPKIAKS